MNKVDYDEKQFDSDGYGNLTAKFEYYKNYKIDDGIGAVKVWDCQDNFVNEYPDMKTAKAAIDSMIDD